MARSVSRRLFAGSVVTAASTLLGADPAKTEAALPPEAQRQYQAILEGHAAQLSDAGKADLRRLLAEGLKGIEPLRAFPLENGNEPSTIFRPWRADRS